MNAMEDLGIKDEVACVSGIGCSSWIPCYYDLDVMHTMHGRALAFAEGLKLAQPDKKILVFTGDGDCLAIGGNHLIHAARRNIDLTVICVNNDIYGMTGGQISPTSPEGSYATTAPYGSKDKPFNIAEVAKAAGASYVAKYTVAQPIQVSNAIKEGLANKGFSFIEVIAQCPTYYGRKNKLKTPISMIEWFKENTITLEQAEDMTDEQLVGKIITGVYVNKPRAEFIESIDEVIAQNSDVTPDDNINKAYMGD
jgi:2-oxoglutarate ferredoxin oxidoreductase subunit beta